MCSNESELLAKIGLAIDELAGDAGTTTLGAGQAGQADDIANRLARLWAMVAELDPELTRRVPGYGA